MFKPKSMQETPQTSRTELSTLGEFGLIELLSQNIVHYHQQTHKGIGDDAAVLQYNDDKKVLVSSDLLMENVHFDLSYHPLKHLGYKAVVVNLSDIAAMNALPKQITVNLALSNRFSVEAVEELYKGIRLACENYHVDLVGGDTTASASGLVISITAIGEAKPEQVSYRSGAQVNDVICVSGDLGAAYLGLQILLREKEVFAQNPEMQPELSGKDYLLQRQLRPEARTDLIYEFAEKQVQPTAMIDLSDGLASDLLHLCSQSGLGAVIFEDKLPIDQLTYDTAVEFGVAPATCALNGGEDYELLFTLSPQKYEEVRKTLNIFPIGYTTKAEEGVYLSTKSEEMIPITAQGWQHFGKS